MTSSKETSEKKAFRTSGMAQGTLLTTALSKKLPCLDSAATVRTPANAEEAACQSHTTLQEKGTILTVITE
jgi:hypothetical protein